MTPQTHSLQNVGSERGIALIAALLMMLVMSALAIALTASGRVEVAMGDNEELYAGARAAAESGLNHTAAVIIGMANVAGPAFQLNNLLQGPDGNVDDNNPSASSNADNGLMTHLMTNSQACTADAQLMCWTVPGTGGDFSYTVRLFDDDDPAMNLVNGVPTAFSDDQLEAMGPPPDDPPEDGTAFTDINRRLVIRATGFGPRGTSATLEQMLTPIKMPALLVDGDLLMDGNARILGSQGSVHANGNLTVDGNSVWIAQTATSTLVLDPDPLPETIVGEMSSGGMPEIPVFDIQAANYLAEADFRLRADGTITLPNSTTVICSATVNPNNSMYCGTKVPQGFNPPYTQPFGWTYGCQAGNCQWRLQDANVLSATFFAESDVLISGNGSGSLALSVIATGSIEVSGTPNLQPEPNSQLMFVTNKDLEIAGDLTQQLNVEGRILVREQIHFTGNASVVGQVIVQNMPHTAGTPVDENVVEGNFSLTYNGLIETVAYTVSGWRETQ